MLRGLGLVRLKFGSASRPGSRLAHIFLVVIGLSLGGVVAHAKTFGDVDVLLIKALSASTDSLARQTLKQADTALTQANSVQSKTDDIDLDVAARASFIDTIQKVFAHDLNNDVFQSIRQQVRALDLLQSLWRASESGQARKSKHLTALLEAAYKRIRTTGRKDLNSSAIVAVPKPDELLYRVFVKAASTGKLNAYELSGQPTSWQAKWKQTAFDNSPPKIARFIEKILEVNSDFDTKSYPFLVLLNGNSSAQPSRTGRQIVEIAKSALRKGSLVFALESEQQVAPLETVPTIGASASGTDEPLSDVTMIHRSTGGVLLRMDNVGTVKSLKRAATQIFDFASEIAKDVRVTTAPEEDTGMVLESLANATNELISVERDTQQYAVVSPLKAKLVNGTGYVELSPDMPLSKHADRKNSDWMQFVVEPLDLKVPKETNANEEPDTAELAKPKQPIVWIKQISIEDFKARPKQLEKKSETDGESSIFSSIRNLLGGE